MPVFQALAPATSLTWSGALTTSAAGVLLCGVLILAARLLLPRAELGKSRTPALLLLAHVICVATFVATREWPPVSNLARTLALLTLLLALGRIGFVVIVDAVLSRRYGHRVPKIFRDILEGLVYGGVVLVVLRQAGAQLDALLTTSALLTAVIGLSLQDTLGNLFAGLSIQAQNPFEVGDWIQYQGDQATLGRVIEINWRATKVMTLDAVEVIIPNGQLARVPIYNFTRPTPVSRRSIAVVLPFTESPHRVHRVLLEAVRHVGGVLPEPPPVVLTSTFEERGIKYWVHYFTADFGAREQTDARVRDRIWFALHRENIPIASPVGTVHLETDDDARRNRTQAEALARRIEALRCVGFLRVLSEEQLQALGRSAAERLYSDGEVIIRQGDAGDEFFIVLRGEVGVVVGREATEVARLHAGAFFGEMSVLTGEPRRASVRAYSDTQVLVVGKDALKRLLEQSPELADDLSDALTSRGEQLDSATSRGQTPVVEPHRVAERRELLARIKEFFSL